jgi:hypothetical protein
MENEVATTNTPKQSIWANVSLIPSLLAYILALLSFILDFGPAICFAFPCWFASLLFGAHALMEIRTKRTAFKGKRQAIIGIASSAIPLIITIALSWMIYSAIRGEPYDESHPQLVLATIEKNCDFRFPEKMESLKAADRLAGGPDNPYFFVIRFKTNREGFAQLKDALELKPHKDTTSEVVNDKDDPRFFSISKETPLWYSAKIPKGKTWEGFLVSSNNMMRLSTVCVELSESGKVDVYMGGFGDSSLRKELISR